MRWVPVLLLILPSVIAASQPTFVYTFPGVGPDSSSGSGNSYSFGVTAMKIDSAGNTYLTGYTRTTIPVTPDAFQLQGTTGSGGTGSLVCTGPPLSGIPSGPCANAFLIKLDPTGALVYGTYLGGSATAIGTALAIDSAGDIYVCGLTQPPGFPVTSDAAFQTANVNVVSAFVAKFDPSAHNLIYSTYVPGITGNVAMATDAAGNVYIAGTTMPACLPGQGCGTPYSAIFPTTPGALQPSAKNSSSAGVVAALNASGSALIYATYLSGSVVSAQQYPDQVEAIAVDAAGDALVTGSTGAADFPVTAGAFQTQLPNSTSAAFVAKLNPQGNALLYSTFLGGNGGDFGQAIKVDSYGGAWVLGQTSSTNFPLTSGAFESAPDDHFLVHLSANGASLIYATYFPGILGAGQGLDVDAAGGAYVASSVSTAGLPTGPTPLESNFGGDIDAYIAQFTSTGKLVGASYLGGTGVTYVGLIGIAPNGSLGVAGVTQSPDFPGITQPVAGGRVAYVTTLVPWLTLPTPARLHRR